MSVPAASFYFDLSSPHAYLVAEQLPSLLGGTVDWQPVLARELAPAETLEAISRTDLERRADAQGLQPVVWPDPFPFDSELAMHVATFAKTIGRVVSFSLAAFRQAFAAGADLSQPDPVLIAAAACEMHPQAVLRSAGRRSIAQRLEQTTEQARAAGVTAVPSLRLGDRLLVGSESIDLALVSLTG
ncbi:MAG TPA: DsbA family protein [Solirubrobacteraceae bacterium]|nr:DsbA family protein [Solirubrobacteraceae bacterium]